MARRSDHSREELKDLILKAAWNIISAEGFEKLSARSLAKKIGYAPGTIYNVFTDMDHLFVEINMRTLDLLYEALNQPLPANMSPSSRDDIRFMAQQYIEFSKTYRPQWLMLFRNEQPEIRKESEVYLKKINCLFVPLENLLQQTDPNNYKLSARTLWASIHGICFLQETGKLSLTNKDATIDNMIDRLIENF